MGAIGPGDWLECIDTRALPDGRECPLTLNAKYQIAAVWDYLPYAGKDGGWMDCSVDLVGWDGPGKWLAWGLYRFKPVDGERLLMRQVVMDLSA